jgi:5-carboxymethyl-2-hydroxymuconate isomerase
VPHLTVEFSANIEDAIRVDALLDRLHETALATGVFPLGGIRVRAFRVEHYRIADCDPANGYVHVTARVGHGRTRDVLAHAGRALFDALNDHLAGLYEASPLAISLTLEELHPELNYKRNNLHRYVESRREVADTRGGTQRDG